MLLRRITEHVKDQNWFAVFLDFLIVVVGVFIGIQVANWNEMRGDLKRAKLLETRLTDEFLIIESDTIDTIQLLEGWQKDNRELSQLILTGELLVNDEYLVTKIDRVGYWLQPSGTSSTYKEIIAQGDSDLLRSSNLRSALLEFHTVAERHIDANLTFFQSVEDYLTVTERIMAIASIPATERPENFSQILQNDLSSLDLYLSTVNFIRTRGFDLLWHRNRLENACRVLTALEQPCTAVNYKAKGAEE